MPDFKCAKCGRTFSMAAHLARHLSASHGPAKKKTAAKKKTKKRRAKRKVARKAKVRRRRISRVPQRGLRGMSLEALGRLISDARAEVRRRIADIEKAML